MELEISNKTIKYLIDYVFSLGKSIQITSIDTEDFGKTFTINPKDIISIEEDVLNDEENCYIIWWKLYNPLEGKYITMSNNFIKFKFTDLINN